MTALEAVAATARKGRMLTAQQIANEKMNGTVTPGWVRRHVPGKIRLSQRLVRWYEAEFDEWLERSRVEPKQAQEQGGPAGV